MVPLESFIDLILPAAPWPWGWLSHWHKWIPGISPGGKGGRCVGLTTITSSCAECLEILVASTFWRCKGRPGLYGDWFAFYLSHPPQHIIDNTGKRLIGIQVGTWGFKIKLDLRQVPDTIVGVKCTFTATHSVTTYQFHAEPFNGSVHICHSRRGIM
jgi:hypothetical protein